MPKKKKVKKVKKVKKAKKVKFLDKGKSPLKSSDKKSTIPGPDEKQEPMKDHEKFRDIKDKYDKHFSEKPGK